MRDRTAARRRATLRRTRSSPQQLHDQLERAVLSEEAVSTLGLLQRGADPNARITAPPIRTPRSLPASRSVSRAAGLRPPPPPSKLPSFSSPSRSVGQLSSNEPRFLHKPVPKRRGDKTPPKRAASADPETGGGGGEDNYGFTSDEDDEEDEKRREPRSETLLHRAARSGSAELVRVLLEHGADVAARDSAQRTPLHAAAAAEASGDVLQLLVSARGALVNAQDLVGDTALHLALRLQNRRHTVILLEAGARADIRNLSGRTPLAHLVTDFPQALETAFDHSLRLVRPLGWGARAVQFDYSLFDPCLLDDEDVPEHACIETRLLNSIDNVATRDQLFLHPLCQSFLNLKWKVISPFYVIDIVIFAIFVVSFNVFVFAVVDRRREENITATAMTSNFGGVEDAIPPSGSVSSSAGVSFNVTYFDMPLETITFFLVAATCLYIDLREMAKMWVLGVVPYARGPENLITWFCTCTAIACLCTDVLTFEQLRQVAAVCLLASWTELLFMFGRAEFASTHVMLFVTLIRTLSVFMMVYTAITFAFTSSFYVLFCDRPEEFDGRFDTMTSAFFTTVVMSIGELNYDPTQLSGSKGGYFLYLLFIFFMLIITMNGMVGMAVNDTRDMAAKAEIKLHKKYLEFACLFERHMQWRSRGRLWGALPSVGVTLLSMLPERRLAASWHELPERPLGWRHRWRVMFSSSWHGDAQRRTESAAQLRRWLAERPGLLRQAARIVLSKHHDSWDQPIEPGAADFNETETDGPLKTSKSLDGKDMNKDGKDMNKDAKDVKDMNKDAKDVKGMDKDSNGDAQGVTKAAKPILLRRRQGRVTIAGERPDTTTPAGVPAGGPAGVPEEEDPEEYSGEDEPDGGLLPPEQQMLELRHAVLDLKCQLGKMQGELTKIGRAVAKIAYTQQTTVHN